MLGRTKWIKENFQKGYLPRMVLRLLTELSKGRLEKLKLKELPETSVFKKQNLETLIRVDYNLMHKEIEILYYEQNDYYILSCAKHNDATLITIDIDY